MRLWLGRIVLPSCWCSDQMKRPDMSYCSDEMTGGNTVTITSRPSDHSDPQRSTFISRSTFQMEIFPISLLSCIWREGGGDTHLSSGR